MESANQPPATASGAAFKKRGNAHLQEGKLEQAAECYRKAVAADPSDAVAHVNLGFALRELQRLADAQRTLQQAVVLDPNSGDAHYLLGTLAVARNAPDEAIEHFQRALDVQPSLEEAYRELFSLLVRTGQTDAAKEVIARAIGRWPQSADLRGYLGSVLNQQGDHAAAVVCYREALALSPNFPEAHNDLGCAQEKLGQLDDAVDSYNHALALRPDYADALVNLGNVCARRGRLDEARAFYERAIAANRDRPEAHAGLAYVFEKQGKTQDAIRCFREVVRLEPTHPASRVLALLSGAHVDRAPGEFVERVFDECADTFDHQLQVILSYGIPQLLVNALEQVAQPRPGQWDILDLGCGTGLVGVAVAPFARQLVGVDLSSKMLAKAAERNVYQRLERLDLLTALMKEGTVTYDLVLAADVFVYIGKLDELIAEAKRVLRPGGIMGFSTEDVESTAVALAPPNEPPEYQLKRTHRFGHSSAYLRRLAADNGFEVRHMSPVQVRTEAGNPVHGHLVLWSRPGAPGSA